MPPKPPPVVRLKGQACLDFWNAICPAGSTEVSSTTLEAKLTSYFPKSDPYFVKLIVGYVILEFTPGKPTKPSIAVDEFDRFVRRFLPFEDCVPLSIASLIDKNTRWFYPWFHGYLKPDFAPNGGNQFFVRLSTNMQPTHGDKQDLIPAHCLVLHYNREKDSKMSLAVRLINRKKTDTKYQFQQSSDDNFYDSFPELIKARMIDQGYLGLPSPLKPPSIAMASGAAANNPGMYHSQISIEADAKAAGPQTKASKTVLCECQAGADTWCGECGMAYCEACAKKDHSKGTRVNHKLSRLAYCDECGLAAAKQCVECQTSFCAACCAKVHDGTVRHTHTIRAR